MKTVFFVATLAVGLLLLALQGTRAQPRDGDPPPDQVLERTHDLSTVIAGAEHGSIISPLDAVTIAGDGGVRADDECWSVLQGFRSPMLADPDGLTALFSGLDPDGLIDDLEFELDSPPVARFKAPKSVHDRVEWFLGALRRYADARIDIEVLRFEQRPESALVDRAQAKGELVASTSVAHGGIALMGTVTERRVVVAPHPAGAGEFRDMGELSDGLQWRVAAALLPGGRVRVQATLSGAKAGPMRPWYTPTGPVEMPDLRWTFAACAGVVENGGGLVLDGGDTLYLVRATSNDSLEHIERENGLATLLNPAGFPDASHIITGWVHHRQDGEHRVFSPRLLPQSGAGVHRSRRYYPLPESDDSPADWLHEALGDSPANEANLRIRPAGPALLKIREAIGEDDGETKAGRDHWERVLSRMTAGPDFASMRAVAYALPAKTEPPPAFATGKPALRDVQALGGIAGSKLLFDRVTCAEAGQNVDLLDTHLRNFVPLQQHHEYQGKSSWRTTVSTDAAGWQLRLARGPNARLSARLAMRAEAPIVHVKRQGTAPGTDFESIAGDYVEVSLEARAPDGEWRSVMQRRADGALLVLCVEAR